MRNLAPPKQSPRRAKPGSGYSESPYGIQCRYLVMSNSKNCGVFCWASVYLMTALTTVSTCVRVIFGAGERATADSSNICPRISAVVTGTLPGEPIFRGTPAPYVGCQV